ncbi:hypothetical protein LSG31_05155 [Fodinisporobacter ferrooxydans]|uniref:Spore coat protein n=2 Tax=Fodinisporobacter ferrooxydans TaxID=2901836 RepID=A0ABY4CQX6_9BACL|nr:hypothetical protein LSG31_05155 [Alicyclobacillaceae bacterium MYW30-H2]
MYQPNQQQSYMQQQPVMMRPPRVITTKDAMYLKDQMSWLLLAMKKCKHFANECQDQRIAQLINQIGQMHERHYNMLLRNSQMNNAVMMQNVQQQQYEQQQKQQYVQQQQQYGQQMYPSHMQ